MKWFRRRPKHVATVVLRYPVAMSPTDHRIAAWWGYTPAEWVALSPEVRANRRDLVAQAPGLGVGR